MCKVSLTFRLNHVCQVRAHGLPIQILIRNLTVISGARLIVKETVNHPHEYNSYVVHPFHSHITTISFLSRAPVSSRPFLPLVARHHTVP